MIYNTVSAFKCVQTIVSTIPMSNRMCSGFHIKHNTYIVITPFLY